MSRASDKITMGSSWKVQKSKNQVIEQDIMSFSCKEIEEAIDMQVPYCFACHVQPCNSMYPILTNMSLFGNPYTPIESLWKRALELQWDILRIALKKHGGSIDNWTTHGLHSPKVGRRTSDRSWGEQLEYEVGDTVEQATMMCCI